MGKENNADTEYLVVKPGHYAARFPTEQQAVSHWNDLSTRSVLSGFTVCRADQLPKAKELMDTSKELERVT